MHIMHTTYKYSGYCSNDAWEMRGSKPEYEDAPGDAEMGGGNGVCERCFVDVDDVEKM